MKKLIFIKNLPSEEENRVLIYGNPDGLLFLAEQLRSLALISQDDLAGLPVGIGHHEHLYRDEDLCAASDNVVIGRLDGKGTGDASWLMVQHRNGVFTDVFGE